MYSKNRLFLAKKIFLLFNYIARAGIGYLITKRKLNYTDAKPTKLINVNPSQIFLSTQTFNNLQNHLPDKIVLDNKGRPHKIKNIGKVIDGDWDLYVEDIHKTRTFRLLHDRFAKNMQWQECAVYKECLTLIATGRDINWHKIFTRDDISKRTSKLDKLFNDIKKNGYKTQNELVSKFTPFFKRKIISFENKVSNEITVNIDRKGNFIHNCSGKHRLAIAQILNINSIPVRVLIRHKNWQEIRNQFNKSKKHKNGLPEYLKKYSDHPDIEDIRPA